MSFLSREATVARPGFNRWLVPPAAVAVHMCIGQVYAFNVFNVPLTQAGAGWTIPQVGWIYSIALFMLGISAAVFGKWVERSGPRKTMLASCLCFCGGLLLAALGVKLKLLWLLYLGYGFTGGIGLGLGYISPVSTLMRWFPDRPGMATGEQELLEHCASQLARFKVPARIEMVSTLPRTALNKVLRAKLRQDLAGRTPAVRGSAAGGQA